VASAAHCPQVQADALSGVLLNQEAVSSLASIGVTTLEELMHMSRSQPALVEIALGGMKSRQMRSVLDLLQTQAQIMRILR
jgi:hypothetical protein